MRSPLLFLLGICLPLSPLFAQTALAPLDPSVPLEISAAAGFSLLDKSGDPDPKQTGNVGLIRYNGGGNAGDDQINWSTKGQGAFLGLALGPFYLKAHSLSKKSSLYWISGGSFCGQLDGIFNCGGLSAGATRGQEYNEGRLDLAILLGPLSMGARYGNDQLKQTDTATVTRNIQGASLGLQILGHLYAGLGLETVKESHSGFAPFSWNRQMGGVGIEFGDTWRIRAEVDRGSSDYAKVTDSATGSYVYHASEAISQTQLELQANQIVFGVENKLTSLPAIVSQGVVARSTQISSLRASWLYPEGFTFTYEIQNQIYSMDISEADRSLEGKLTRLSLGKAF
ncbi:MAG: hypothetical protein A2600_01770 [Candidatus Lambdaproteobacteria bacterium RIFOXYD1_FULL_56_27]|uniref:Autotransporter domain-containing protein n=1 Tax=Candidatus Lambdaproteobacteria bacterium RIFOXYD2_FULL_56_26 TaxID=1817773 RepID=A0A1F6GMT4_9PROT|nr:MAG: hypothetical protein A2557_12660 [Candidatus Lambdaproteobacteria bacterium RIFOXYD2_FULL_56_26]OGH05573.1 MAG: hypothetical protein A2426_04560 [Candidatus Lambdaproteobacteria bacterium RIFOXYC1_FULL_56_13]OGH08532.1 MAG: hypothetical protein A2600_01770 [Candidatus Lambdaproteobacteria bacterium RIFOXYD1_FULL_56_27]